MGGLVLGTVLRADELALTDNPYAPIVQRNVFGLNPPAPPVTEAPPDIPKITANGIQNFLGKTQVLFKVSGFSKPGQPPKDIFYTLKEGERQDDIEVVKIDEKNGIITFKNHGAIQDVALSSASSGGGMPSALPVNVPHNGMTPPAPTGAGGDNSPRGFGRFGQRGGGFGRGLNGVNGGANNPTAPGGDNMNLNLRSIPTRIYQPEAPPGNSDQNALQIESQRAAALDNGDPKAALFPPTPLTGKY